MNQAKDSALIAIQYLFATQASFAQQADISSDSLFDYHADSKTIRTASMTDEGACFGLNLEYFSIDVLHPDFGEMASYPLSNANHLEIINWIGREKYLLGIESNLNFKASTPEIEGVFHDRFHHAKVSKESLQALDSFFALISQVNAELNEVFDVVSSLKIDSSSFDVLLNGQIDQQTFEVRFKIQDQSNFLVNISNSENLNQSEIKEFSDFEAKSVSELIKTYVSEFLTVRG